MATDLIETNAPELSARLQAMGARIEDPAPALERARALLARNEAAVWASQGSALGASWAPAVQAENKTDSRLLVATGRLRASLTGGDAGTVIGPELRFGTDVPYGTYHQYGTSKMVARPFLGLAPDLAQDITQALAVAEEESWA